MGIPLYYTDKLYNNSMQTVPPIAYAILDHTIQEQYFHLVGSDHLQISGTLLHMCRVRCRLQP